MYNHSDMQDICPYYVTHLLIMVLIWRKLSNVLAVLSGKWSHLWLPSSVNSSVFVLITYCSLVVQLTCCKYRWVQLCS